MDGLEFGFNLPTAALGLGAISDLFGGYSQQQAQQRQRALYQQYLQQQQNLQNPQWVLGQAQPYYQANLQALQSGLPAFMRSTVNPMLGAQGIDPTGGLGNELTQQAIAPQLQQAWQNALGQVTGQNQSALNALGGATGNVGVPSGQLGGTANALQSLMLWRALQGRQPQQTDGSTTTPGTDFSSLMPAGYTGQNLMSGTGAFGLQSSFLPQTPSSGFNYNLVP
jgi:hypothetical protein